jgi:diguanylate cyclase
MTEELRWKDKYLENLEQQERLDQHWNAQLDLLRRGLVRSSLAAEGVDPAVDRCMRDLREILRKDDMYAALQEIIPRLERILLEGDRQREERNQQVLGALAQLAAQLQELELPAELHRRLKGFSRQLAKRVEQVYNWPTLLSELSEMQQAALQTSEAPRGGLLQRLFGGAGQVSQEQQQEQQQDPLDHSRAEDGDSLAPQSANLGVTMLDSLPLPADLLSGGAGTSAVELDSFSLNLSDPGYSAIAEHVQTTLLGLLDELKAPQSHVAQVESLRERINAGLNLYELVPVLDDLSSLVLSVAGMGMNEFQGYLQQLNERLAAFQETLQGAHQGHADAVSASRELDSELRQQVDGLHGCVQEVGSLADLKALVEGRLQGLIGTMDEHQRQRDLREQETAERLRSLVERVARMELEAKSFQEHLELQRQKALVDSLTELPNRAAWHERLAIEVARWQRYGGQLLLAVIDVDLFKRINDGYGHLAGDKVLRMIASELKKRLRATDFIARFGGEEFVLLLPGTPLEGGTQLVESLREGIQACPFHFRGERVVITLSAGIAAFGEGDSAESVFERADQALYHAKDSGRNRVEVAKGLALTRTPALAGQHQTNAEADQEHAGQALQPAAKPGTRA